MGEMNAILEGLNDVQREAVCCTEGPVLVIAGAGSGKTRVLTSRVSYIIGKGVDPSSILALTFTKKAASEMKERIALMVGDRNARKICMGTFHSVFIRFLREYAKVLGYPESFTIYDTSDSVSAIKACLKEMGLDEKVYKPKDVLSRISMAKNNLVTPAAYSANRNAVENDTRAKKPYICKVYDAYWRKCRNSGVMDFDDILFNMNILLKISPDALKDLSSRFSHVLVDEYQDTNHAQYLILKQMCSKFRNICVVGDDSQSIYAFRGAKIENIINFRKDYPDCRLFRLEQNYRSTQTIVNAANSLIAKNSTRIPKKCFSKGDQGDKIRIIQAYSDKEEAYQVVSSISSLIRKEKAEYSNFAILYRTNAQSRVFEEQLRNNNLPYVIYSGNSFFDRAEVKDMMAYLKLVANINDDESFKRIVNKPARGIGDTSVAALAAAAHKTGVSLFKAAYQEDLLECGMKAPAILKVRTFCDMISGLALMVKDADAYDLGRKIAMDSGLLMFYKSDNSIEGQSRTANVEELLDSIKAFVEEQDNLAAEDIQLENDVVEVSKSDLPTVTLDSYLENISLLSAVDMESDEESNNKIALMTVHSSKGLEFPYVYVVGMEENIFPSGGSYASETEIEEERRLFYVAMTRACRKLTLSCAEQRIRNGKTENNSPSRFVKEIDRAYLLNPLDDFTPSDEGADPFYTEVLGGNYGRRNPMDYSGRRGRLGSDTRSSYGKYADSRQGFAKTSVSSVTKSSPSVLSRPTALSRPSAVVPERKLSADFVPSPILEIQQGQRVEHNRFGFGTVTQLITNEGDRRAKVDFDEHGEKLLILKYAKIRIVTAD